MFIWLLINKGTRLDADFLIPKPFATSLQKNYFYNGEIFSPNSLNGHRGREECNLRGSGKIGCELGVGGYAGFACMGKSRDANQGRLMLSRQYISVSIRESSLGVTQVMVR